MWGYEVYEMMKRLFLVAILPLLGEGVMRAFIGILVSTGAAFWARESWPFVKSTNSRLALAANVQILGVFFASAVLITDSLGSFGLDDLTMGVLLLLLNLVCLVLVAYWCIKIEAAEMERRAWRQNLELSWTEQQLVRVGFVVLMLRWRGVNFDTCLRLSVLRHIDEGALKILWSTMQIVSSVQWNLSKWD